MSLPVVPRSEYLELLSRRDYRQKWLLHQCQMADAPRPRAGDIYELPDFGSIQTPEDGRALSPLLTGNGDIACQLDIRMSGGADRCGEVWLAKLIRSDVTAVPTSSTQTTPSAASHIVLKFIQSSLISPPEFDIGHDDEIICDPYPPEWLAINEAESYRRARVLQGKELPYFFGMGTYRTTLGEEAWYLATEYIPGQTFEELAASASKYDHPHNEAFHDTLDLGTSGQDCIARLYRSAVDGLLKLHDCGLKHGDIASRNLIVTSLTSPSVVFIDPRCSAPTKQKDGQFFKELSDLYLEMVFEPFPCCCGKMRYDDFYNSTPGPPLREMPGDWTK